jgi:hypothetical protein
MLPILSTVRAQSDVPPQAYVTDLVARRARLAATLGPDTMLILWSAPTRVYSTDTNYEYRQESNLLYLTGIDEPATTVVLTSDRSATRPILFVRALDPFRELWDGHTLTPAEVTSRSGVVRVRPQRGTEAFDAFIEGLLAGRESLEAPGFSAALAAGRARLALLAPCLGAGIDGATSRTTACWRKATTWAPAADQDVVRAGHSTS